MRPERASLMGGAPSPEDSQPSWWRAISIASAANMAERPLHRSSRPTEKGGMTRRSSFLSEAKTRSAAVKISAAKVLASCQLESVLRPAAPAPRWKQRRTPPGSAWRVSTDFAVRSGGGRQPARPLCKAASLRRASRARRNGWCRVRSSAPRSRTAHAPRKSWGAVSRQRTSGKEEAVSRIESRPPARRSPKKRSGVTGGAVDTRVAVPGGTITAAGSHSVPGSTAPGGLRAFGIFRKSRLCSLRRRKSSTCIRGRE